MHSASTEPSDLPRVPRADRRIAQRVARRLSYYAMRPADIDHRLAQIDREWPVDRMLQANAATLSLAGLLLGAFVDRRMLWVPVAAAGFLLQHALRGWCPPLPLLRAMGGRTAEEISLERFALKALRGDFRAVPQAGTWQPALEADIGGEAEPGTPAAAAMRDRAAMAMAAARR